MFEPKGSLEERIDKLEKDSEKSQDYARRFREAAQEESADRLEDFDVLQLKNMPWMDVRAYGMAISETAANNRTYLQAAIDGAPTNGVVIIPRDSEAYSLDNGTPVTITHGLTLIIEGEIDFTDDTTDFCDVTGDDVAIIGRGGKIKGPGTFDCNDSITSAVFHVTGDRFTCRDLILEDPVQCGIYLYGANDFTIDNIRIVGGLTAAAWAGAPHSSGTEYYGIEIENDSVGGDVTNCKIVPNASGGICVQGIAGALGSGLPQFIRITGNYMEGLHDHSIYTRIDHCIISNNTFDSCTPIKHTGLYPIITNNLISADNTGGIVVRDCEGAKISDNLIKDYGYVGIQITEVGSYTGNFDNILIDNNTIIAGTGTYVDDGIRFGLGDGAALNVQIINNKIRDAGSTQTGNEGISVYTDGTNQIQRFKIDGNVIDGAGIEGISLKYCNHGTVSNNFIRNPGTASAKDGIKVTQNCDDVYIHDNKIIDEKAVPDMPYGINVVASASNTNIFVEFNKITGAQTADILITSTEGKVISMTSAGYVGINRPAPNSGAFAEVGGNIAAGYSDTGKIMLHNAAATERAGLQLTDSGGAGVQINADGAVKFYPNNTYRGSFLSDGGVKIPDLKSGATQAAAGAAVGELWVDTDDDNTIKLGV